ncbi:MAG TPA: helix-turn-helix transcriptional regulator [Acidobacteriaceae bacterium]
MDGIGIQLRAARQRLGLTLREVEERTSQLAQQWGNLAYRISASWLDRVERENRGLSATKLIVLAFIYNLTMEQMLALCPGVHESPAQLELVSSPNSTLLLAKGPLADHAKLWLPDKLVTDPPPEDTMLLQSDQGVLPVHYRRGIIGRRDRTMEPMILAGSIVLIDTQKRAIAKRKDWTNEFDRPIYFLLTRSSYFCGFCELDKNGEYLKLVPHALSPQTEDEEERRWKYRKQVEVIGTVAAIFTRRAA